MFVFIWNITRPGVNSVKSNAVILKRHMILKIIVVSFFQRGGLQMGRLILVSIGDSAQVPSVSEKKTTNRIRSIAVAKPLSLEGYMPSLEM